MKIKSSFFFLSLLFCSIVFAEIDVNDINIQGDSTLMGMKIESSYFSGRAFLIETTGARFEYVKGQLKIYQGLDKTNRRLLSTITFDNEPNFIKVKASDDHILLWSKDLNLGIYGDSTCIIAPKEKLDISFKGNFKPDYEGRYKGELLLIDDLGGMEIYPQRYEAGYKVKKIELGKSDWVANYELNAGERVMVAAFPAREFDWEKSFKRDIVSTCGSVGLGQGNPYGQMPSDFAIRRWSINFDIIRMFFTGLYKKDNLYKRAHPGGPYIVANETEFRRFLRTSHETGMKVTAYCSLYYYAHKHKDFEGFYEQIKALRDEFGIDGVYIDGLTFDGEGYKIDNKIANWEMVRRLRQLFGPNGVITYHGTSLGSPVATVPNIDVYCDATTNGEGVAFKSVNDPYIKYQVRKYGISNTVATWNTGPHPSSITYKDIIDATIRMNGRRLWGGFVLTKKPPPGNRYVWPIKLTPDYRYYLEQREKLKEAYQAAKSKPKR